MTCERLSSHHWAEIGDLIAATGIEAGDGYLSVNRPLLEACNTWLWKHGTDGYALFIISDHPAYGDSCAQSVAIYLSPEARGSALQFIRRIEKDLKSMGVERLMVGAPHLSRFPALLEAMGYDCIELVMRKMV